MSTKPLFLLRKAKKSSGEPDVVLWASNDFESTCEHFEDMAKKTVIRKLFKYLPVSIEIQRAVSMDGKEVETINPDDISVIAGEYSVIDNPEE